MRDCRYCGTKHEPHEDTLCGCGCGSEPMGCTECVAGGGPVTLAETERMKRGLGGWRPDMAEDMSDYDREMW